MRLNELGKAARLYHELIDINLHIDYVRDNPGEPIVGIMIGSTRLELTGKEVTDVWKDARNYILDVLIKRRQKIRIKLEQLGVKL